MLNMYLPSVFTVTYTYSVAKKYPEIVIPPYYYYYINLFTTYARVCEPHLMLNVVYNG